MPAGRRPDRAGRSLDLPGAALSTSAMLLLVYTIVQAPTVGWATGRTLGSLAAAVALVAAFVAVEQRAKHPLLRLGILRSPTLRRANLSAMVVFGGWVGFQFVGTLYLQQLRGWSALEMALAFLPTGLIVAFASPRIGGIVDRFGLPRVIATGMAFFVAAYGLSTRIGADSSYVTTLLPTLLLAGLGFAAVFGPLNIAATAGVADEEQGLASGLVATSFQLGGAIVLAVVTAVINSGTAGSAARTGSAAAQLDGFHPALLVVTIVALGGFVLALGTLAATAGGRIGRLREAWRASALAGERS